jgi:hypothetical protein
MSHLFIVKKSDGYHIDALFSETSDGDYYSIKCTCTHRRPTKDDGTYDFYDCVQKGLGKDVEVSRVSFNPKLFQVVEEQEDDIDAEA